MASQFARAASGALLFALVAACGGGGAVADTRPPAGHQRVAGLQVALDPDGIPKYEIGMQLVAKVAVSIPRTTLRSLERVRKRLHRSRSAVVTLALDRWLREQEFGSEDQRYVRGYLEVPERTDEVAAVAAAAAAEWEPWS